MRSAAVRLRVRAGDAQLIRTAARYAGCTVSELLRDAGLAAARAILDARPDREPPALEPDLADVLRDAARATGESPGALLGRAIAREDARIMHRSGRDAA